MHVSSYAKRILDTMSRYRYVDYAYEEMAEWMQNGTEEEKKLKRHIHRFLDIPKSSLHPPEKKEDAKEILMQFGYQYTNALLRYCGDTLKDGMFAIPTLTHSHIHTVTRSTLTRTGYYIMSVRTTEQFKKLPVGKVCMVYFHAVDIVLGRKDQVRKAWRSSCHLPKVLFADKVKGRKPLLKSAMTRNYEFFKRMLAVKEAVFGKHKKMLKLYEQYCNLLQPGAPMYWGDVDEIVDPSAIAEAANVNEASCADGF